MSGVWIRHFGTWDEVVRPAELCCLVQEIQQAPPYGYAPGEIPDASDWFPELVRSGGDTHVAYDDKQRPIGYLVLLPLVDYHDGVRTAALVGIDPTDTVYVAELGVDPGARRRGLGAGLLRVALDAPCGDTTRFLVRTLVGNEPALRLYQRAGFRVVDGVEDSRHSRPRVYLVRDAILGSRP